MTKRRADQHKTADDLRRRAEERQALERARSTDIAEELSSKEARRLIYELQVHQIELEMQNDELRRTQVELRALHDSYFDLYDRAPVGYVTINEQGSILEANLKAASLLGVSRTRLINHPFTRFIVPEDQDTFYLHRKKLSEAGVSQTWEMRMRRDKEGHFWVLIGATAITQADGVLVNRIALSDITDLKASKDALREANARLEAEHEKLQTKDTALQVILDHIHEEKVRANAQIAANMERVIAPLLQSLKRRVGRDHEDHVAVIERALEDMTSPFVDTISRKFPRLSPREIQVCSMIRNGMSSKDIADRLGVALQTVLKFRQRIRRKLEIADPGTDIATYLRSL